MLKARSRGFGVVAHLQALPNQADELRSRLHELTGLTRHEAGCVSCEMIENRCDSTEFTLIQEWSDERAHDAHFAADPIQTALQFLPTLLTQELGPRRRMQRMNLVRYGVNSYGPAAT
jgi:quinol monooxygenase YgiN